MRARLVVDAHPVCPRVGKGGDKLVRVLDHQVAVERERGHLAQALHYRRPDGDIGHKMPIHDVHMNGGSASALGGGNLFRQPRKISRQDGWQQLNHARTTPAVSLPAAQLYDSLRLRWFWLYGDPDFDSARACLRIEGLGVALDQAGFAGQSRHISRLREPLAEDAADCILQLRDVAVMRKNRVVGCWDFKLNQAVDQRGAG